MKQVSNRPARSSSKRLPALPQQTFAVGLTAYFSCQYDNRFSYCLYVPEQLDDNPEIDAKLIVVVHGSLRHVESLRDAYAAFARWNHCIILLPLFAVGVFGDDYGDGYKDLIERGVRYDEVLLHMVDEAASRYGVSIDKFAIFGYSGGGQFVNRFLFLHPEKLWAACIGAPGRVTLADTGRDWWVGIRNAERIFGRSVDLDAVRRVPVQLLVGSLDMETREIHVDKDDPHWMEGANDAGATRIERLWALKASLEAAGVPVTYQLLPGAAHDGEKAVDPVCGFLAMQLARLRSQGGSSQET